MTVTKAALAAATPAILTVKLDSKGAAVTDTQMVDAAPVAGTITAVEFLPNGAVTGDNTNTRTFTLTNKGQTGAGSTVVATLALTTGNDLVAADAKAFTLSGTPANLVVAAGDVLQLAQTIGASGLAHAGGVLRIVIAHT